MYSTKKGLSFDGDKWENFCQVCFRLKYENEGYQAMPADVKGDLGIEGFTRTGKVFQCYCPDSNTNNIKLYEDQRDKMSTDLGKLFKNRDVLPNYLGEVIIKQWIFVVPEYSNKDLIKHYQTKKDEIKNLNLKFLCEDFDILVHDIGFFAREIPLVINNENEKLNIGGDKKLVEEQYHDWKGKEIDLVQNSIRKQEKRFPQNTINISQKVNELTDRDVRAYLNGKIITRNWSDIYPEQYEKFLEMIDIIEEQVKDLCLFPPDEENYNSRYKEINIMVEEKVRSYFSTIDERTIISLCKYVMADWILRCPINFE